MRRILAFDARDAFLFELDPSQVTAAVRTAELNGAHALDISTAQALPQSTRLLLSDGMGGWEEYVVSGGDEAHESGLCAVGSYHAVWSCQYDLCTVNADDVEVGGESDAGCADAMALALDGTSRWRVGTVDAPGAYTFLFESKSAWERVQMVAEQYGGEIAQRVVVGRSGVTERYVDMRARIGSARVTRRFEWKRDLARIVRRVPEQPPCCRIIPVGSSADVTIYDVNTAYRHYDSDGGFVTDQVPFVEDQEAALAYRMPDGQGGWEYPTRRVKFDIDDDRELLAYALAHVSEYTRPTPTYEADVLQYAAAGMDWTGVALGDPVHVVDEGFNPDVPLRIEARVVAMAENLLDPTDVQLKVGDLSEGLSSTLRTLDGAIAGVSRKVSDIFGGGAGTARYIEWVTEQLNSYINALGGYGYIVPGVGIITYSVPVTDPAVGDEAKQVIRTGGSASVTWIGGGGIKIANSLDQQGDWKWQTLIVAGKIATEVLTASNIVAGKIEDARNRQNPGTGNYWDLDASVFDMRNGSILADLVTAGKMQSANGKVYFDLDNNEMACDRIVSTVTGEKTVASVAYNQYNTSASAYRYGLNVYRSDHEPAAVRLLPGQTDTDRGYIFSKNGMSLFGGTYYASAGSTVDVLSSQLNLEASAGGQIILHGSSYSSGGDIDITSAHGIDVTCGGGSSTVFPITFSGNAASFNYLRTSGNLNVGGNATVDGYMRVSGAKPRLVSTESYGKRLLYAYETPAPYFGDIGSGAVGDDGLCVVEIGDVFRETARTDMGYQAFVQPIGGGTVRLVEKRAECFVVEGEPGTAFDWEVKAHQVGFEHDCLECTDNEADVLLDAAWLPDPTDAYGDYVTQMEELYASEIQEAA